MQEFYITLVMIIVGLVGGMIGMIVSNIQQRRLENLRIEHMKEDHQQEQDRPQQEDYFSQF